MRLKNLEECPALGKVETPSAYSSRRKSKVGVAKKTEGVGNQLWLQDQLAGAWCAHSCKAPHRKAEVEKLLLYHTWPVVAMRMCLSDSEPRDLNTPRTQWPSSEIQCCIQAEAMLPTDGTLWHASCE
jgi:hypothetical protein